MMNKLQTRIKELRKEHGLTQKQLAQMLGKSETGLASWEQGLSEPCVADIIKLCEIFHVSSDYLLGITEL